MSYDYRISSVIRVVDGDTIDFCIDVGFRMTTTQRIRLLYIDTPERGEANWAEATTFTKNWLDTHAGKLRIATQKADSFGRYLGRIYAWYPPRKGEGDTVLPPKTVDLATDLVEAGLAKEYLA